MKGIIKKALTVGLAGIMGLASIGLMGCTDDDLDVTNTEDRVNLTSNRNVFIVINENGIDTLHKGDVVTYIWDSGGYGGPASLPTVLKFNCGKNVQTYQFVAYPNGCPTEEEYDKVCDCAREIKLNHDSEVSSESEINYDVIDREL